MGAERLSSDRRRKIFNDSLSRRSFGSIAAFCLRRIFAQELLENIELSSGGLHSTSCGLTFVELHRDQVDGRTRKYDGVRCVTTRPTDFRHHVSPVIDHVPQQLQ